jgi:hypothetical protein
VGQEIDYQAPSLASIESPNSKDPDTTRALQRYQEVTQRMKAALKIRRNDWASFKFPELEAISEYDQVATLREEIAKTLHDRKTSINNKSTWLKIKGVVERFFVALTPFAKHVLAVASGAQAVLSRNCFMLIISRFKILMACYAADSCSSLRYECFSWHF